MKLRISVSPYGKTYLKSDQTGFSIQLNGDYGSTLNANNIIFDDIPVSTITGSASADTLTGLLGSELIEGLGGDDTIDGGDGADIFRFSHTSDSVRGLPGDRAYDRITDFTVGEDTIDLSALGFTGIVFGSAAAGELRVHYSSNSDRTYIRDDHGSDFEFYLNGNYMSTISNSDFVF